MNIIEKTISLVSPSTALKRMQARSALDVMRKYEVGKRGDKKNKNWDTSDMSADADLLGSLSLIRARARDLYKNSPISKRIADIYVGDIVGAGVTVEFEDQSLDELFKEFSDSSLIDSEGVRDFYDMQSLVIETIYHSGEVLVKRIIDPNTKHGIKFQILDPDYVDHNKNENHQSEGTVTIQGVKFDGDGKVLGYWIFDEHPGGVSIIPKNFVSKFREYGEYVLIFDKTTRASAARGIVPNVSVLQKIKDVSDTFSAEVIRRKIATCMVGIIVNPDGISSDEDEDQDLAFKPGSFGKLRPGHDIRFNTPPPVSDFSPFIQDNLRLVAMGSSVTYESLSMNLSTVNFSSARMGRINVTPKIKKWQSHILINQFCKFITQEFLKAQIIKKPSISNTNVTYTAPALIQVDPITENNADKYAIRNGFKSISRVIRERGEDPRKLLKEISKDQKMLDELGLVLDSDPRKSSLAGNPNLILEESNDKENT